MERAKQDMQVEESFLGDKFRQLRAENELLKAEIESFRGRLVNATEDYVGVCACIACNPLWLCPSGHKHPAAAHPAAA